MKHEPIVMERIYNAPVDAVWQALTDKEQMKQWYFDLADFKPEPGFTFQFVGGPEDRQYVHICKVTQVIAGKKLQYSWQYQGFEGLSIVTFELTAEGEKTRLTLTHEGLDTFPGNNPDFRKENFVGGWTEILGTSLKKFLEPTTATN